ncbi:MAG: cysteine desulfurase [Clostridiales bacterium]|nr:cysteine desulfurase [Clostridiales bacterium]
MKVYLDNSATTRPDDQVIQTMSLSMSNHYFNPSALYPPAVEVDQMMAECRRNIQRILNSPGQVIFTSSGTEADNLAILGTVKNNHQHGRILHSAGEHAAVLESCKYLSESGYDVESIPLKRDGQIDMIKYEKLLTENTQLISIMQINNETGAVSPISQISKLRDAICPDAHLHVDGVQGFLRHDCNAFDLGIDSYALSAHKFHGPKGIGALWISDRVTMSALIRGGGQENGIRSGTQNTSGIAGMNRAIEIYPRINNMRNMKLRLYRHLLIKIPELIINGSDPEAITSADHILNISLPPVRSETMLNALAAVNVYVGNGSACSSKKRQSSHVLKAMKTNQNIIDSAIRLSLNPNITEMQIDYAVECIADIYKKFKPFVRR